MSFEKLGWHAIRIAPRDLLNHDDRSARPVNQQLFSSVIMARDLGRHVSFQVKTAMQNE
jgi:hypothetical protein